MTEHATEKDAPSTNERPCFGCGHIHLVGSPGRCWEAACDPACPEDHNDFDGPFTYTPDDGNDGGSAGWGYR